MKSINTNKYKMESNTLPVNDMSKTLSEITVDRFKKLTSKGTKIISQIWSKLTGKTAAKRILAYHKESIVPIPKSSSVGAFRLRHKDICFYKCYLLYNR